MIPAHGHYDAVYTRDYNGKTFTDTRPVEAFDHNGAALVVDHNGQLVPASTLTGFAEVRQSANQVAAAVPGGGWTIRFTDPDSDHQWSEQVVAWTINSTGTAVPLTIQDDDYAVAVECTDLANGRLIPPTSAAQRIADDTPTVIHETLDRIEAAAHGATDDSLRPVLESIVGQARLRLSDITKVA